MRIGKYIVGALSGLTFGLLFAPKKGEELRDEIKKKGGKSKQEALSVLIEAFKEAGVEALDEAKKTSEGQSLQAAIGNSKEKMHEYFSQIEKTGQDIAARAKQKLDELHGMAEGGSANFKKTALKKAQRVKKTVVTRSKRAVSQIKKKVEGVIDSATKKSAPKKTVKTEKKSTPKNSATLKTTVKKISKK